MTNIAQLGRIGGDVQAGKRVGVEMTIKTNRRPSGIDHPQVLHSPSNQYVDLQCTFENHLSRLKGIGQSHRNKFRKESVETDSKTSIRIASATSWAVISALTCLAPCSPGRNTPRSPGCARPSSPIFFPVSLLGGVGG
jgi:hypothetical protein